MEWLSLLGLLDRLPSVFYPFCRMIAFCSFAPLLSEKSITLRLRVALALVISLLIAPAQCLSPSDTFFLSGCPAHYQSMRDRRGARTQHAVCVCRHPLSRRGHCPTNGALFCLVFR
ncbi:flagellar biosynthetic protein FliR [Rosenbergiella nectarea]|uniref:flagellar biosynthetic protein FliR n=1 Tax=Rosenbergiella nectarea TaxID=988801 RepID=UPI002E76A53F|nr:flagellar biosynthetic protein FliR [Rosenbergiella nectarea]